MEKLEDLLPELGRIFTYDLERFKDVWFDVLYNYMAVFDKLFYIVGVENPDLEKRVVEVVKEFIASRQKPYEEWKTYDWLSHELRQVMGEELNRTYDKLRGFVSLLVRRIAEDGRNMGFSRSFYDIVSDYSLIMDYLMAIFSRPDIDIASGAEEALEAFIQGKENREGLKYRLGRIVDQFQ
jgi:putative lipoic acid-binding regulatory protein